MQARTAARFTHPLRTDRSAGLDVEPYWKPVMQQRHTVSPAQITDERACVCGERWRTYLVRVQSGVAARDRERYRPGLRAESWALFRTSEQIDTYVKDDPRRFTDPLPHSQLQSAFARVFDRSGRRKTGNEA